MIRAANIQLPFALIIMAFGPISGIVISKIGSIKPTIVGTVITSLGFFSLMLFHYTEFMISTSLSILAIGFSLTIVGAMNIITLSTPRESTGTSMGITYLMRITGNSIGPVIAGIYLQSYQLLLKTNGIIHSVPSEVSFNLIFLTGTGISIVGRFVIAPEIQNKKRAFASFTIGILRWGFTKRRSERSDTSMDSRPLLCKYGNRVLNCLTYSTKSFLHPK